MDGGVCFRKVFSPKTLFIGSPCLKKGHYSRESCGRDCTNLVPMSTRKKVGNRFPLRGLELRVSTQGTCPFISERIPKGVFDLETLVLKDRFRVPSLWPVAPFSLLVEPPFSPGSASPSQCPLLSPRISPSSCSHCLFFFSYTKGTQVFRE